MSEITAPRRTNGYAIAGFIVGLVAIITCWIPVFGVVAAAAGILFSGVGLWFTKGKQRGYGLAAAGMVMAAVAAFLFVLLLLIYVGATTS